MAMLIPVTNQKTKSIRSACFDAGFGSQGTKKATADVTAAAASPTATKRTSTPLRTIASLLNPQERRVLRTSVTNPLRRWFPRDRVGYPAACGPHHRKGPERRTTWESEEVCYRSPPEP